MILSQVRAGLATQLATIPALKRVHGTFPTAVHQSPVAVIGDPDGTYDDTMSGTVQLRWQVYVLLGRQDDQRNQVDVDTFIDTEGPNSVHAAIDADTGLGGAVSDARVAGWSNYGANYVFGETTFVGVTFDVEIYD